MEVIPSLSGRRGKARMGEVINKKSLNFLLFKKHNQYKVLANPPSEVIRVYRIQLYSLLTRQRLCQLRHDSEQITDNPVVTFFKDRRLLIFIDSNNNL